MNVSREEQKNRFLSRLNEPQKHWKFSRKDVDERKHWDDYMHAYQQALAATSKPWAPWYAIPADDKAHMRVCVADIIVSTLRSPGLDYPRIGPDEHAQRVCAKFSKMTDGASHGMVFSLSRCRTWRAGEPAAKLRTGRGGRNMD